MESCLRMTDGSARPLGGSAGVSLTGGAVIFSRNNSFHLMETSRFHRCLAVTSSLIVIFFQTRGTRVSQETSA